MTKNKTVRVSEEELSALQAYRQQQAEQVHKEPSGIAAAKDAVATDAQQALADAFVSAIERTRPKAKVLIHVPNTPWQPKGVPRLKLKRKMYHHGLQIEDKLSNEEIDLLNKVKPGRYCDGYVQVNLRKDKGLDIDYPVRTTSQRLRLINQFGLRSFAELLQRVIDEKSNPSKYRSAIDNDLYDLE